MGKLHMPKVAGFMLAALILASGAIVYVSTPHGGSGNGNGNTSGTTSTNSSSTETVQPGVSPCSGDLVLSVDRNNPASVKYEATDPAGKISPIVDSDPGVVLQKAIDQLNKQTSSGPSGGTIAVTVGEYDFGGPTDSSGTITLKDNVALVGCLPGPFEYSSLNNLAAPLFEVRSTSSAFITMKSNTAVDNLLFYYPDQVGPSSSKPIAYPPTILVTEVEAKVQGSSFVNSYDAISVQAGRNYLENLAIGALHDGIIVDNAYDFVIISNIVNQAFWDTYLGINTINQPIDSWVMAHGTALVVDRADGIQIDNFDAFAKGVGINIGQNPTCPQNCGSYGNAANVEVEVGVGINVTTQAPTWSFTNLIDFCNVACIKITGTPGEASGPLPVSLRVDGGQFVCPSTDIGACVTVSQGNYFIADVENVWGYPTANGGADSPVLPSPPIPLSGTSLTNTFFMPVRIFISGGSVSQVSIDNTPTGITSGMIELKPGETVTIYYNANQNSPPLEWTWFGL